MCRRPAAAQPQGVVLPSATTLIFRHDPLQPPIFSPATWPISPPSVRDIHRHPETAFEEVRTAQIVADKLTSWGIEVHRGLATTGVVGTLKGNRPGQKTIGLRADMDALHLQERNDFEYASSMSNKMHACAMTATPRCCWARPGGSRRAPDFGGTVHFISSPPRKGWAARG